MKIALLIALGCCAVCFTFLWARSIFYQLKRRPATGGAKLIGAVPRPLDILLGFLTNFFDTLGIGSFATTSAALKLRNVIPDEVLPGTLNVGHCLPSVVEAFIFIAIVQVDVITLISMIAASVIGAWLGAG